LAQTLGTVPNVWQGIAWQFSIQDLDP